MNVPHGRDDDVKKIEIARIEAARAGDARAEQPA